MISWFTTRHHKIVIIIFEVGRSISLDLYTDYDCVFVDVKFNRTLEYEWTFDLCVALNDTMSKLTKKKKKKRIPGVQHFKVPWTIYLNLLLNRLK